MSTNFTQSTIGVRESVNMVEDIVLEAMLEEIVLPKIEYDYNSAELRKESKDVLNKLIIVLLKTLMLLFSYVLIQITGRVMNSTCSYPKKELKFV